MSVPMFSHFKMEVVRFFSSAQRRKADEGVRIAHLDPDTRMNSKDEFLQGTNLFLIPVRGVGMWNDQNGGVLYPGLDDQLWPWGSPAATNVLCIVEGSSASPVIWTWEERPRRSSSTRQGGALGRGRRGSVGGGEGRKTNPWGVTFFKPFLVLLRTSWNFVRESESCQDKRELGCCARVWDNFWFSCKSDTMWPGRKPKHVMDIRTCE